MLSFDFSILDFIYYHCHNGILDIIMPVITSLGNKGMIWISLAVALIISKNYRKTGIAVLCALVLDLIVCNMFLKPFVARIRPYDINTAVKLLIARPTDFSFPSGHTAASFASVSALFFSHKWLWKPALVLSVLIAFSRLYLYVHYPTDVLGGMMIGIVMGYIGYKVAEISSHAWKKHVV
ncbi:MAG: phosphatase PAP2 family protein [Clostridia bacterium]|jgi:undecaprenyl-diphosphatase|nr:phosphatase PAP2 family protein [Clostridia bacterium]MCI2000254.1 phosphatase PAP2 family protein [Clostridia bacterium]MCI2014581.1 phosphatase PAP2 family protein [Clostridia bacterium]